MPPTTTTRQQRKLRTRAALKQAARACFAERGYRDTGIADIAAAAGVANGTFYVHFTDKEELVDELLGEFNDAFARQLEPLLLTGGGRLALDDVIRTAAEAMLDHWRAHRDLIEAYVERSRSALSLSSLRDGVNPPMAALLRQALEAAAGPNADIHAELVTQALLGMWLRVGLQHLFGRKVTRKAAVETLVRLTAAAIRATLAEGAAEA